MIPRRPPPPPDDGDEMMLVSPPGQQEDEIKIRVLGVNDQGSLVVQEKDVNEYASALEDIVTGTLQMDVPNLEELILAMVRWYEHEERPKISGLEKTEDVQNRLREELRNCHAQLEELSGQDAANQEIEKIRKENDDVRTVVWG
ncbi:hypothetical protein GNI_023030 [Gregarina niphandrodes]|uniref:Uncharacterized protein n=1 Tax=Gregarina niphandrodes TaxID=110365 RepID=A0A023BBK7_GRENI|nr:hypothetical protein GNI_023030 [Gregarina niphandrodes]EZG80011.1 hypothetical protein GNI_023030 [Gregarina niphandrodes]|eukprot:XP_011134342.1 hypothetical protein GNI_023030 [Gregarina niphandrodes]